MKRYVLWYGLLGGVLIALLKSVEYRFLVVEHSMELYGGLVAVLFAVLGIWLGVTLSRPAPTPSPATSPATSPAGNIAPAPAASLAMAPITGTALRDDLGVTPREREILALMADGLSNREIAERIFVSENTVKTHSSRLFDKLGARRRTQAVQLGKQRGLIP